MSNPLPNSTTTANFRDTILSSGGPCQSGNVLIANNPAQIILESGPEQGSTRETLYPFISPSIFPLVAGRDEYIWSVRFADFLSGQHAQVSGWLIPVGLAGPAGGNPFTQTVTVAGQVLSQGLQFLSVAPTTADVTLVQALQDLTGGSITFSVTGSNAKVFWTASWEMYATATGWGQALGWVALDGNIVLPRGNFVDQGLATDRGMVATAGVFSVAAGSHTVKLQAQKVLAGGAAQCLETNGGTALAIAVQDA